MSETARWNAPGPPRPSPQQQPAGQNGGGGGANLADILERVLDKGIVIAGDIQVNLLDIELLTIKIRLVVASVDRAKEMGIDWWERDPTLSAGQRELEDENRDLRARIEALERNGHRETAERELAPGPDDEPPDDEPPDDEPPDEEPPDDDITDDVSDDVSDEDAPDDERATRGDGRSGRAAADRDGAARTGNGSGKRARGGTDRDTPARRRPGSKRSSPARER